MPIHLFLWLKKREDNEQLHLFDDTTSYYNRCGFEWDKTGRNVILSKRDEIHEAPTQKIPPRDPRVQTMLEVPYGYVGLKAILTAGLRSESEVWTLNVPKGARRGLFPTSDGIP